jgi:hypothetical protein
VLGNVLGNALGNPEGMGGSVLGRPVGKSHGVPPSGCATAIAPASECDGPGCRGSAGLAGAVDVASGATGGAEGALGRTGAALAAEDAVFVPAVFVPASPPCMDLRKSHPATASSTHHMTAQPTTNVAFCQAIVHTSLPESPRFNERK